MQSPVLASEGAKINIPQYKYCPERRYKLEPMLIFLEMSSFYGPYMQINAYF